MRLLSQHRRHLFRPSIATAGRQQGGLDSPPRCEQRPARADARRGRLHAHRAPERPGQALHGVHRSRRRWHGRRSAVSEQEPNHPGNAGCEVQSSDVPGFERLSPGGLRRLQRPCVAHGLRCGSGHAAGCHRRDSTPRGAWVCAACRCPASPFGAPRTTPISTTAQRRSIRFGLHPGSRLAHDVPRLHRARPAHLPGRWRRGGELRRAFAGAGHGTHRQPMRLRPCDEEQREALSMSAWRCRTLICWSHRSGAMRRAWWNISFVNSHHALSPYSKESISKCCSMRISRSRSCIFLSWLHESSLRVAGKIAGSSRCACASSPADNRVARIAVGTAACGSAGSRWHWSWSVRHVFDPCQVVVGSTLGDVDCAGNRFGQPA